MERVSFEKKEWAADERRDSRWRSGDKNVERLDVRTRGGIGIGTWIKIANGFGFGSVLFGSLIG